MRTLLLLFYATHSIVYGQGWTQTDTLPLANRYDDVYFNSDDSGWTVSSNGEIFKTINGGDSWQKVYTSQRYLRSIEFISDSIGFAGSLDGVLLRTTDAGESWHAIEDSISGSFPGVCGLSHIGNHVYGVGIYDGPPRFLKSVNAGITWTNKDLSGVAEGLVDVYFKDTLTGFIGGKDAEGAIILKTTDGGHTWESIFTGPVEFSYVWKLFFVNSVIAYASIESFDGVFRIAKTTDGGDSWILMNGPAGLYDIQGIGFDTPLHGWVSPRSDSIFETHDGGMTWEKSENLKNINRFFQVPGGRLYASGSQIYFRGGTSGTSTFIEPRYYHSLSVFPIPFSKELTILAEIDTRTDVRIGITSVDGKHNVTLYRGRLDEGTHPFYVTSDQLAGLPKGLLIVYLTTDEGFFSKQILPE